MPRTNHEPTIPSDRDAVLAREATRVLDSRVIGDGTLKMQIIGGGNENAAFDLSPAAAALLRELLVEMAAGRAITIVPTDAEVTTGEAADLLRVSRPFVVGLIDKGELPARMVGAHRRLLLEDVLTYKRESKVKARAALKDMITISQELGLE
jgi:excisionase family DNA binding protein